MLRVFETIATYDRDIEAGFSIELAPITVPALSAPSVYNVEIP